MTTSRETRPDDVLTTTFRAEYGRVLATLIREFGDFDLAEDALADAIAEAAGAWTPDTIPKRPAAWLLVVARRRAIDRLRRERTRDRILPQLVEVSSDDGEEEPSAVYDDRLRLVFTCCHPALGTEAQVALTLSAVAGLPTTEIARAFLVSEGAMAQRLTRAKGKIRDAGIPFRIPPDHLLVDRIAGVLATVYLIFTSGYTAGAGGRLIHRELCEEAIRLGRVLTELLPDEPEVTGLLALMLLQHARLDARVGEEGELVTLEDQDRSLWDREMIEEGTRLLKTALRRRRVGPYQLQAAIAAVHIQAATFAKTDWQQIAGLYGELARLSPTPAIEVNRAVAVAYASGPERGLTLLDRLGNRLDRWHLFHAARGELLVRAGRAGEAATAFRRALALAENEVESRHLSRRLATLGE